MYQKWAQEGFVSTSSKRPDERDGPSQWYSLLVVVAAEDGAVRFFFLSLLAQHLPCRLPPRNFRSLSRQSSSSLPRGGACLVLLPLSGERAASLTHHDRYAARMLPLHHEQLDALKNTAWQADLAQRFGAIGIAAPAFLQLEPGASR